MIPDQISWDQFLETLSRPDGCSGTCERNQSLQDAARFLADENAKLRALTPQLEQLAELQFQTRMLVWLSAFFFFAFLLAVAWR